MKRPGKSNKSKHETLQCNKHAASKGNTAKETRDAGINRHNFCPARGSSYELWWHLGESGCSMNVYCGRLNNL